ncbi:MAG: acetamidase/formamidase family protein [Armatimonadetes bacterium]|nr:acetamidase/formamidase family protein [Armatimonadota bacterium]
MHITNESPIYRLSKSDKPVARVAPGERFTVDTRDCFGGGINTPRAPSGPQYWGPVTPATGPLSVEGAAKGDILAVHIHRISVSDTGVMIVAPKMGAVGDWIRRTETRILDIRDGCVIFGELRVPINPMIGVIGTAPKGAAVPCGKPGEHGGNMDCKLIGEGSTLYLPVNVDGALLSMGDIHAVMGDGEVCVTGVECSGTVELETSILRNTSLPTPIVETGEVIATIASHADLDAAAHNAIRKMLDLLQTRFGMKRNEAAMWMSAFADLRICQVVNPLKTCRMEAPKSALTASGLECRLS